MRLLSRLVRTAFTLAALFGAASIATSGIAMAQCVDERTFDFDGSVLDTMLVDASAGQGSLSVAGGRLVMTKFNDLVGRAACGMRAPHEICGDFDITVDYNLDNFPPAAAGSGRFHAMLLIDPVTGALVAGAERYREQTNDCIPSTDSYKFYTTVPGCTPTATYVSTSDTQGKLRLQRTGATIHGYCWNGSAWVEGMNRPCPRGPVRVVFTSGTNGTLMTGHVASFDNLSITSSDGLSLWLRSDAGVHESGGTISQWDDQSGQLHHAIQPDPAQQPTVATGPRNIPVLRFDGMDDLLGFTGDDVHSQITLCIVQKLDAGAGGSAYYPVSLGAGPDVTGAYYGLETRNSSSGDSENIVDVFAGFDNDARASASLVSAFGHWKIIVVRSDQVIGNTSLRVNGAPAIVTRTGSNVSLSVALGNATGTGYGGVGGTGNDAAVAKCDIAEVRVYNGLLSDAAISALESSLADKYGISFFPQNVICDSFNGPALQPYWLSSGNACATPAIVDGELTFAQSSGCSGGAAVLLDPSVHTIHGDFDITVDFALPDFGVPGAGDRIATFQLMTLSSQYYATIERYNRVLGACNPGTENYKAWFTNSDNCNGSAVRWAATGDDQGRFRLQRAGTHVTASYWSNGWVELHGADLPAEPVKLSLLAAILNGSSGHDVRFDNLCINANYVTDVPGADAKTSPRVRLSAGVPNPFRLGTTLGFELASAGRVRLEVFDLLGRRVATLLDEEKAAGHHSVDWRPNGAAAGVYLVRLEAGDQSAITQLLRVN